jgi:hypothetical protein
MCEVCREFETPLNVVRVFLSYTASLKLYGDSEEVFTPGSNSVSPLLRNFNVADKRSGKRNGYLFAFIVRGDHNKQQSLEDRAECRLRLC